MAQFRGWRFVHPDFDRAEERPGLQVSVSGRIGMVEDRELVRQSLLLLISTIPGERVMRPEYGCHLHRLIFAPNDDTTAGLAIHYVRSAIERWEPRIEVQRLDAAPHPEDPERLEILLDYRISLTGQNDQFALSIPIAR